MVFPKKHGGLLENNQKFRTWYETTYNEKSPKSADNMKRNISLFCDRTGISPDELLKLSNAKLNDVFEKFRDDMQKAGKMGTYISKFKHSINNFQRFSKRSVMVNVDIRNENKSSKYNGEIIPTKPILQSILDTATPRARVIISLMAFSGLRPESTGDYLGNDGLKLKDLSGLDLNTLEFTEFPSKIRVRDTMLATARLSKNGKGYWTLCGKQTQKYISKYLSERRNSGEILTLESPLVTFGSKGYGLTNVKLIQLSTEHVRRDVRDSMKRAGFNQRPYVLRRYFMQTLSTAELKGFISMEWRLFLSGHSGNIQATYVSEKENLNPSLEQAVKDAYVKCLKLLETERYEDQEDKTMLYTALLATAHFTEEEINGMNLNSLSDGDIVNLIRKRLGDSLKGNSEKFKFVSSQDDMNLLASKGYQFRGFQPNTGLAVMELVI